jgi:hypothetical protein
LLIVCVWRFAAFGVVLAGLACAAGNVRAATTLETPLANTGTHPFTFDNLSFAITSCSFNGGTCSGSDDAAIYGVSGGRGGTEIEIAGTSSVTSAIYSGNGSRNNRVDDTLTFTITVSPKTGSQGISSVKETITGAASSSSLDGDITSKLSGFTPTGTPSSISVNPGSTSASDAFNMVTIGNTLTFTVALNLNASQLTSSGQTLSLTNVALLFTPAPEPASIAVFATALAGLGAARRRFQRKSITHGIFLPRGATRSRKMRL